VTRNHFRVTVSGAIVAALRPSYGTGCYSRRRDKSATAIITRHIIRSSRSISLSARGGDLRNSISRLSYSRNRAQSSPAFSRPHRPSIGVQRSRFRLFRRIADRRSSASATRKLGNTGTTTYVQHFASCDCMRACMCVRGVYTRARTRTRITRTHRRHACETASM